MSEIADRIKELIDSKGLSNSEFAKETDLNPAIISHILSGRNKASLQVISQVKDAFTNVNLDYLITGQGELFNDLTNVKEGQGEASQQATQPSTAFPMEGVRMVSVPGFPPAGNQSSPDDPPSPSEARSDQTPADNQSKNPSSGTSKADQFEKQADNSAIERIVIFYKDGSFKAYQP